MANISGFITSTNTAAELGAEVWLDQTCVLNCEHVDSPQNFVCTVDDQDAEHELRIVMKHKRAEHTKINQQGGIDEDACLTVSDLRVDDIDLPLLVFCDHIYTHDFNGTRPLSSHRFYGVMGCNGEVVLKFTTPIELWLLEKL